MSLSKYSKKVWIPEVGSKPHQPLVNFKFPYREFGKQKLVKRTFQHSWFAKWKWLHYEEDMDKAFCYNCIQVYKEDKLRASNLELAFISKGFNNWKDASVKFKEHKSSNCHKDSMIVTVDLPSSVKDIAETLQRELTKQKSDQLCLEKGRELFGMKVEMLRQNFTHLLKGIIDKHISKSWMLFAAQLKTGSDNRGISFIRIWSNYC